MRNSIKSLAKIQNYIHPLPFIHNISVDEEGYKIKKDRFMITAAKTATYRHIPHESFFIHKSGWASFLVGSLSTCDKKLSPTDFKNF